MDCSIHDLSEWGYPVHPADCQLFRDFCFGIIARPFHQALMPNVTRACLQHTDFHRVVANPPIAAGSGHSLR